MISFDATMHSSCFQFEILSPWNLGSALIGAEAELEEEEDTETYEKTVVNKTLQKNVIQNSVEQNPDSTLPATPLRCVRYKSSSSLPKIFIPTDICF